jgi:hypothetical protein
MAEDVDPIDMPPDEPVPGYVFWEGPTRCYVCGWSGRSVIPIPEGTSAPAVPIECGGCRNMTLRPDDPEAAPEDGAGYALVCPYWVDTDAYSDRDRLMFACGAEFTIVLGHVRDSKDTLSRTIHRENESRVRMMCGRFGRSCKITPCGEDVDPAGSWSYLEVFPKGPEVRRDQDG